MGGGKISNAVISVAVVVKLMMTMRSMTLILMMKGKAADNDPPFLRFLQQTRLLMIILHSEMFEVI